MQRHLRRGRWVQVGVKSGPFFSRTTDLNKARVLAVRQVSINVEAQDGVQRRIRVEKIVENDNLGIFAPHRVNESGQASRIPFSYH